jgi:Sec-independent protein secretion pathway component TatC
MFFSGVGHIVIQLIIHSVTQFPFTIRDNPVASTPSVDAPDIHFIFTTPFEAFTVSVDACAKIGYGISQPNGLGY